MLRLICTCILLFCGFAHAQNCFVSGRVLDDQKYPLEAVSVLDKSTGKRVSTDANGYFKIEVSCRGTNLLVRYPSYPAREFEIFNGSLDLGEIILKDYVLDTFDIVTHRPGVLNPVPHIETGLLPLPNNRVEDIIKTFGLGVRSTNEMSANYNTRGGNFDENLIYVNNIEVYRPFLVRAGQQEGLSFINPDLVDDIYFSSGGFDAKYDDRISSVLSIVYKRPHEFKGSFSGGIMGGTVHLEGEGPKHRFTWMIGARYQANGYVLKTMDTKGDYRPRFGDFQSLVTYNITDDVEISWLNYVASNNYRLYNHAVETTVIGKGCAFNGFIVNAYVGNGIKRIGRQYNT